MLFLTLIIYLLLFPVCYFAIQPATLLWVDLGWYEWSGVALAVSLLISMFIGRFSESLVHIGDRNRLAALVRATGTRWVSLWTVVVIVGLMVYQIIEHQSAPWGWRLAYLLPVVVISLLNVLHIEWNLNLFKWHPVPGRIVLPDSFSAEKQREFSSAYMVRDMSWTFLAGEYSIENFGIRRAVYEQACAKQRVMGPENWGREYVEKGVIGELRQLTRQLYSAGMPFGSYKEVSFVLSFVQQTVEYESDVGEYPKYPIETLAEGKGDCEDFAILAANILSLMGYHTAILLVPGHAALGVAGATGVPGISARHSGRDYFYCEATNEGWSIGQLPDSYEPDQIKVVPVNFVNSNRSLVLSKSA